MSTAHLKLHTELSEDDFLLLLEDSSKFKARSSDTHQEVHVLLLNTGLEKPIWCLLLGDSMLERLKTTGVHTPLGSDTNSQIFNAGVGGDRIQNVLFRLAIKGPFPSLYQGLKSKGGVQYAILHMGTNDLTSKRGLTPRALEQYALVLEAVHRVAPAAKIVVTGLMPRKDVRQELIDQSNAGLQQLAEEYNALVEGSLVQYLPPNPAIDTSHLDDHVHLNEEGYSLFVQPLWDHLSGLTSIQ